MDEIESTAKALHGALMRYAALDSNSTARPAVAQHIFGVTASRRLPMLDELASSVQPASKRSPA
jgi:hypothetical protein